MNCDQFESMLADALGDELAPEDQSRFDEHLAACESCRVEYESLRMATNDLHSLGAPQSVRMVRSGERVFVDDGSLQSDSPKRFRRSTSPLRFAASILLAFVSGYALHAGLILKGDSPSVGDAPVERVQASTEGGITLGAALVSAHKRNPSRSNLAKCFAAVLDGSS